MLERAIRDRNILAGKFAAFAFLPALMAMLSSPQSIMQSAIVTRRHMLGSMPSVLGDLSGARIVMPLTVTPSHSVGTR
jgi:hypothetical protein